MKLFTLLIFIVLIISVLSCNHVDDDCYYPLDITDGTKVIGAGSDQYNGDYHENGDLVNGHYIAEKSDTTYRIEFDNTYGWSIKDNGVIQYYAPGCTESYPFNCISKPFIILNGSPPAPTTERLNYIYPAKCGM